MHLLASCWVSHCDTEIEREHHEKHQHAAKQRVEEELDSSVFTSRPAPDPDKKVHREKHDFPEDVEEEEIQRNKHTHHAGIEKQEKRKVSFDRFVNSPRGEDCDEADQSREENHRHAQPVDPHEIIDVDATKPFNPFDVNP